MLRDYPLPTRSRSVARTEAAAFVWATLLAVLLLCAVAFVTIRVDAQLAQVSQDLGRISTSLGNLNSVGAKLDKLDNLDRAVLQLNAQFAGANRGLAQTNTQLRSLSRSAQSADATLRNMNASLRQVQGQVQHMSRKVSGSFLFRSVK